MLLTDWLKCLSGTHSKSCAPSRTVRRRRARAVCVAEMSSQPEALENRTLLSAANILLTDVSGSIGFQITGASPGGTNFGSSIKPAGDVNGDGFEDVIVGAYYENINTGAAYVLFGKSNGFSSPPDLDNFKATDGFVIRGVNGGIPGPADYVGTAVSGAGDVNGDGFDDILVATARYSATSNGS
ncbi:MAG: integrin alpha, partial [Planctomycetota bacterium]|nr:integrin alpha [Planctomycetota bacterium]